MTSESTKSRVIKTVLATFIAPLAGSLILLLFSVGDKIASTFKETSKDGHLELILGLFVSQAIFFTVIIIVMTLVVALPGYLILVYFRKDNWWSVNTIGLIFGALVGLCFYDEINYGSLFVILTFVLSGIVTSATFYAIARPSKR